MICEVCDTAYSEYPLDHPLHSTNWNLTSKQALDVCSEECKQWALDNEQLTIKRKSLRVRTAQKKTIKLVEDILDVFHNKEFNDYRGPKDFHEAIDRLYRIEGLLEEAGRRIHSYESEE